MHVLAINNYDLDWPKKDYPNVPKHQYWGIDMLRSCGCIVDTRIMQTPYWMKKLFGRYSAILYNFLFALSVALRGGRKYDIIISFFSPSLTFFPFLRKIALLKGKLFAFVHHGGLPKIALSSLDKVFFLSRPIYDDYKQAGLNNCELIDWNPDLAFYERTYNLMKKNENERYMKPILISTGKSFRDDSLLISVCKELKISLQLFSDTENVTDPLIKFAAKDGYPKMLALMQNAAINVVACMDRPQRSKSLCGLTSVIDGLALGMPLILSDNCNLSFDVEKEGFGLIYKAGSFEDLKNKIELLITNQDLMKKMGKKARAFAEKHDYNIYCNQLRNSIIL